MVCVGVTCSCSLLSQGADAIHRILRRRHPCRLSATLLHHSNLHLNHMFAGAVP